MQFVSTHTNTTRDAVATERERVAAEHDAFSTFADRIEALEASQGQSVEEPAQQVGALLSQPSPSKTPLQRARAAYRETVMSVPHYEDDYDESLQVNLAAEFSPEVATAMTTTDAFTPQLRERLLAASQQACDARARMLTVLTQELTRLQTVAENITDLAPDLESPTATSLETMTRTERAEMREDLRAAERRCDDLAADRQATLQTTRMPGPRQGDLTLEEYLYQPLSVTYPVLADLTDLAETLRETRQRIDQGCRARTQDRSRSAVDSRML